MIRNAFIYALEQIPVPQGSQLWLYGEPGFARGDIYHPWQGHADSARHPGANYFSDSAAITQDYGAVFLNCPKHQDETQGLLALAMARSQGLVVAVAANDAGGARLKSMMEAYGVETGQLSKAKCRIVWTTQALQASKERIVEQLAHLAPRQLEMEHRQWWTVPGLFAWNRVDAGSRMLLDHLPKDMSGRVADFGSGFGYIAAHLQTRETVTHIDAFDADARAVACTARNCGPKVKAQWQDITQMHSQPVYNAIVMNPPFHHGKEESYLLGQTFVEKAYQCLKPGGKFYMVANRTLPYEKTVPGLKILHADTAYKILAGGAA